MVLQGRDSDASLWLGVFWHHLVYLQQSNYHEISF